MREIDRIIIHCADTPAGRDDTVADIRRWHTLPPPRGNGWKDVGYHYIIRLDGTIELGRPESEPGAHTQGYNAHSIGVCYVGGKSADGSHPEDTRTPQQKEALVKLLSDLKARYPKASIFGHRDLNSGKACPSFDASAEYKDIGKPH